MNPPTTRNIRAMAIGSNRSTKSLRSHEKQGRSLQNKETSTHKYLEAVQQPMVEPSKRPKCNGYFPRKDTCSSSQSRRFPPRRKQIRTTSRRKSRRGVPKRTRSKGRAKESPYMLLLRKTWSLCKRLPTETKQSGTTRSPSQYSSTYVCSTNPPRRKQHSGSRQ
jgi:hypothetical protein